MQKQISHERRRVDREFPFRLFMSNIGKFPPHWHEEMEIVYVMDDTIEIGLNTEVYSLKSRDFLIISPGDVHYFLPGQQRKKVMILQVGMEMFDHNYSIFGDRRFALSQISNSTVYEGVALKDTHEKLEKHILAIFEEYEQKQEGYKLAFKARLYDMMVLLIRHIPEQRYSVTEKNRRLMMLERLKSVFKYVERNYDKAITLDEIANIANFSVYHFTRFFKESTGMTFGDYITRYRVGRAEILLKNSEESITDIAFKSGFNSIKTFNRVFKILKGCSPSVYRKSNI